jgi:protein-S-isoprenylcysteine O-methyltransferase Ste14
MRIKKPRASVYGVLGILPPTLAHVVVPLLILRRENRRSARANITGLLPGAAGAALVGWAVASHYQVAPSDYSIAVPEYLVESGAYAHTRNPLYLGGALLWTGWAVLFRSTRVAVVGAVWFTAVAIVGVPFEERMLERRFGATYDDYRSLVPRWL